MKTPLLFLASAALALAAEPPEPRFTAVTLDAKIQIGYGLAIADVDGDKAPDVLLADQRQIVWYRNPGPAKAREPGAWTKHLIAENLTEKDNVCLAAQDLDGDGKCELAVGAEWNPGDTEQSGAVFYLIPPADRTQRWEPVKFPSVEPTTHRMKWIRVEDKQKGSKWGLVVLPLHGRGNKNGEGAPVNLNVYFKPVGDPRAEWGKHIIELGMHMTHNFAVLSRHRHTDSLLICGKEGLAMHSQDRTSRNDPCWTEPWYLPSPTTEKNVGTKKSTKVTWGHLPTKDDVGLGFGEAGSGLISEEKEFYATVEPMHGNNLIVYVNTGEGFGMHCNRLPLTDKLIEGHALACGDLLGVKNDQIVVGWRGNPAKPDSTCGIHVWTPLDATGEKWRDSAVDDGGMACEDLQLGDLDGDGRSDIAASGRATKNVKLYFNDTPR